MSAFNSHDFVNASVEQDSYANRVTTYGIVSPFGMLFTAYYSAPNTLTLQFSSYDPAFLAVANSTASKYTISGPSAPTVTSVTFSPGGRTFTLTLSGPLVPTNTYTLAIADFTVNNGEQPNFSGLVVDIILPLELDTIGVGIEQDIALGTPSVDILGNMAMVGIAETVSIGTPVATTLVTETMVGLAEIVDIGTPVAGLFANVTPPGFAQTIALGTPVATLQQEPLGVGFVQAIALGTPLVDGDPEPFLGVGISQTIAFGNPLIFGGNVVGVGINQTVPLGTPVMSVTNRLLPIGVGIEQDVVLGTPVMSITLDSTMVGIGVGVSITLGIPLVTGAWLQITVAQAAGMPDLDAALQKAFGDGTQGTINPDLITPIQDYSDKFTTLQQTQTKLIFEQVAAAYLASTNIPGILPDTNTTDTTTVATTTGTNTMTWVDGILVESDEFDIG